MNLRNWFVDTNEYEPTWFKESWCWFNGGYAYHNGIQWIFLEEEI